MQKAPISVRIIYVLSTIVFWILIVVTSLSFIGNILLETNIIGDEFQLRVQLPVTFDVVETGEAKIGNSYNDIRIEEASGKMHIIDTPQRFSKIVLRLVFAVLMLALFMAWKFKMFITNIKNGEIFEASNINNLKHISYGIMVLFVLTKVYEEILYHTLVKFIEFDSLTMSGGRADRSDMIIAALLLWVLAHIFMKGVEIKNEQELTI
jgi:hypothetical protein